MRIGFIGTGAMASAIARGAVAAGTDGTDLVLTDLDTAAARALAAELGATAVATNAELAAVADMIVLAVKPHVQTAVIADITAVVRERPGVFVVSIAAGRTIDAILADFAAPVPVIRVMPNVNAQIGQGMSAVCPVGASDEQTGAVVSLMESVGRALVMPEKDFPAFQALASCSPAWVFQIIEALARAGVKHGLTKAVATEIAAQALVGSAGLVLAKRADGVVPAQLIDQVCSPGGTTIAGLLAAEADGLSTSLISAVDAAVARDAELA